MPCLFVLIGAFAPRIAFLIIWLFTNLTSQVFNTWIFPLLGVIFLPFTTLIYVLVTYPLGNTNFWGWICLGLAVLVDLRSYYDGYGNRKMIPRMPGTSSSV